MTYLKNDSIQRVRKNVTSADLHEDLGISRIQVHTSEQNLRFEMTSKLAGMTLEVV